MSIDPTHPSESQAASGKRRGMPTWLIILIVVGGLSMLSCIGVCGGLIYLGSAAPDTFVYAGNQVPADYIKTAQGLGLIDPSEQVHFLYSDALIDAEEAMYILTDQHLVLHNSAWADPQRIIAFSEVVSVDAMWSSNWIDDSWITVELTDGYVWSFPLSMENDTDHRFVEKLCESADVQTPP